MAQINVPKLDKDKYKSTGLQRSGELKTGGSESVFAPFIKTKFKKGKQLF